MYWDKSDVYNNIKYLYCMFLGCSSLHNISDIYKFDINNNNMDLIFNGCEKLKNIPDRLKLLKFNIKNIEKLKLNKMKIIYDNKENNIIRIFGKDDTMIYNLKTYNSYLLLYYFLLILL